MTAKFIPYFEKLKDPRWQKRRLEVLERGQWQCEQCEDKDKTLHVHHRYYEKGWNPWDYPDDALSVLCEDCHEWVTKLTASITRGLGKFNTIDQFEAMAKLVEICGMGGGEIAIENFEQAWAAGAYFQIPTQAVIDHVQKHGGMLGSWKELWTLAKAIRDGYMESRR